MARLTYANVVSTLALVVALTGTSAYAAGHINGHDLKKGSVTGKAVKDHSLTGKDVKPGSLDAGTLSAAVQAVLARPASPSAPPIATPFDLSMNGTGPGATQTFSTIGGPTLSGLCATGTPQSPTPNLATAALSTSSSGTGALYLPEGSIGNLAPTPGQPVSVANATGKEYVTASFTWVDSQGVRTATVSARYDDPTHTCRFVGWILHP